MTGVAKSYAVVRVKPGILFSTPVVVGTVKSHSVGRGSFIFCCTATLASPVVAFTDTVRKFGVRSTYLYFQLEAGLIHQRAFHRGEIFLSYKCRLFKKFIFWYKCQFMVLVTTSDYRVLSYKLLNCLPTKKAYFRSQNENNKITTSVKKRSMFKAYIPSLFRFFIIFYFHFKRGRTVCECEWPAPPDISNERRQPVKPSSWARHEVF